MDGRSLFGRCNACVYLPSTAVREVHCFKCITVRLASHPLPFDWLDMLNDELKSLSESACSMITEASAVAEKLARDLASVASISKDDKSPVTVADFAVQAIVGLRLRDCPIVDMVGEGDDSRLRTDDFLLQEVLTAVRTAIPEAHADDILEAIDSGNHVGGPS